MKKIIAYSFNLLFLVTFLASCLGDLDTMPLDNNQLVSDQVYKTKDGYTGVLAKCYSSLILTGQQGGDGGNGIGHGSHSFWGDVSWYDVWHYTMNARKNQAVLQREGAMPAPQGGHFRQRGGRVCAGNPKGCPAR